MQDSESKELIRAGNSILNQNILPTDIMLSAVTNTPAGMDLVLIGMARNQTEQLNRIFKAMDRLESKIFTDDVIDNLKVPAQIELYREAKASFEFRVRFIRDVQSKVDWSKLHNDLLALRSLNDKNSEDSIPKEAQKTVREVLKHVITKTYKVKSK